MKNNTMIFIGGLLIAVEALREILYSFPPDTCGVVLAAFGLGLLMTGVMRKGEDDE